MGLGSHLFESEVLKEIGLASPSLCRRVGAYVWLPSSSAGKESTCKAGDPGLIPGLGRSLGEGIDYPLQYSWASLVDQMVKEPTCNARDPGSILGLGISFGGGPGNSLQYSCLENPCGQRSLEGYSTWSHKESDRTEQLGTAQHSTGAYTSQLVLPYKGPQTGWLTQQTQVFLQFGR